ncbi:VRR-NUC domain-containing protein [Pseudomonas syringae]|nr:VRR-NUC domain-containing protein [Pseudomonas syringae]MBD8802101.1 VRR-NUC domain-containing protein [Pseudomonas syringae]MBD8813870.1 VRR-NUC domain-containing protein [Pseudomonas syringae]
MAGRALASVHIASILERSFACPNLPVNSSALDNPLYYLVNFQQVLAWITQRYDDLLDDQERDFISTFASLPTAAQGLLVRMVMRKGTLFRVSKLSYAELGDTRQAVQPLLALGWVDDHAALDLAALFGLLRKDELAQCFKAHAGKGSERKAQWFERLLALYPDAQPLSQWHPQLDDAVLSLSLNVMGLCDRLRLLYFGNLHQEWSQFVLADLGIYRFETVGFSADSRGITARADIEVCQQLHACRQALELQAELAPLADQALAIDTANEWLRMRRGKLLFLIGQQAERQQDWPLALKVYSACGYPGARSRQIRVLERSADYAQAMALLARAQENPESDAEIQHLQRVLPRLQRQLGLATARRAAARVVKRIDLTVPQQPGLSVEQRVSLHLAEEGDQVHYVENTLINSLFGLLCWPAIFAPLPGAFFHPFHSGPADLHSPDFYTRRAALFDQCLAALESHAWQTVIREHYHSKFGLQSPFVFWNVLSPPLLDVALQCLPPAHLRHWFTRLLQDIKANRTGMPDLIQFYPEQGRYRMIEVKGPGDRLQDNQLRWLDFCARHEMPVEVCYVQWEPQESLDEPVGGMPVG